MLELGKENCKTWLPNYVADPPLSPQTEGRVLNPHNHLINTLSSIQYPKSHLSYIETLYTTLIFPQCVSNSSPVYVADPPQTEG